MISLKDYRTEDALPTEMKTIERRALAYAFDRQKQKYIDRIARVLIWADLEHVSDDKLDFLAVENRVLFYNSDLDPSVKRKLILNSIYWYTKLGTRQAMEEMIDIVFGKACTTWHRLTFRPVSTSKKKLKTRTTTRTTKLPQKPSQSAKRFLSLWRM